MTADDVLANVGPVMGVNENPTQPTPHDPALSFFVCGGAFLGALAADHLAMVAA